MTDAILFSANPSIADVDDARKHLESHEKLYWSVGFPVVKDGFSFPIFGFIHVSGKQVEYRALINDIVPHLPNHYVEEGFKPEPWRQLWKNDPEKHRWKHALIMTEIVPFSFDTRQFQKCGGGLVTHPPQGYVKVFPPNHPSGSIQPQPSQVSIYEKNLEDLVVERLNEIEAGLRLEKRQLSTPAGRIDLFCRDAGGNYVVVELKRTRGTDEVVGQALRYIGWARETYPKTKSRGIIIVTKKDETLRYALKAVTDIEVKEFRLSIT
jgi:hypothetical protein